MRKSKSQLIEELIGLRRDNAELKKIRMKSATADHSADKQPFLSFRSAFTGWARTRLSDGKMIECNKQLALMLGYKTAEEAIDQFTTVDHYADPEARKRLIAELKKNGEVSNFEVKIIRHDGVTIWVEFTARLHLDSGLIESVVVDITKRKQAELIQRESEGKFRVMFDAISEGITTTDLEGTILQANCATARIHGYEDPSQMTGLNAFSFVSEGDKESANRNMEKIFKRGYSDAVQYTLTRADGSEFPGELSVSLIKDENGDPKGFAAITRDISERVAADEALRLSEGRYRSLVNHIPGVVWLSDQYGQTDYISDNVEKIYGFTPEEIYTGGSESWFGNVHPDDVTALKKTYEELFLKNIPFDVEYRIRRKDGEWIWLHDRSFGTYAQDNRLFANGVFFDITVRKLAEEALRKSENRLRSLANRLQEVEEVERKALARELHDQVGQNLSALNLNLNIMHQQLPAESTKKVENRLLDSINLLEETSHGIRDVMADLRPQVLDDYGLVSGIRWYIDRLQKRSGLNIRLQAEELQQRLPDTVESALFRITQEALTNIIKHARAGKVTVSINEGMGKVELIVEDDGCGFDAQASADTEKQKGWGIVNMEERAMAIDGMFDIQSEPGRGTRVLVEIRSSK